MQLFKNNAYSELASDLLIGETTLAVPVGHGDRFPAISGSDFALLTLQDENNNIEIVKITSRPAGSDSMTITRAEEGTTARDWFTGDIVEMRLTVAGLAPLQVFAGAATEADMRAVLSVPTRTGGDASGTWAISVTGNAATATVLQTARTINGTSFNGSASITTATWGTARNITIGGTAKSVNGSANVSWSLAEIGAPSTTGTGASGTWGISITGNAATVTNGLYTSNLGVTVQPYDAATAKTDTAQNFTAPQRSALLTDNDGSFDLSAKQNFKCTPAGAITLTFTGQASGVSGAVILVNSGGHTISAHTNTKLAATDLTRLSVAGTYRIDYLSDGTNAYCSVTGAF